MGWGKNNLVSPTAVPELDRLAEVRDEWELLHWFCKWLELERGIVVSSGRLDELLADFFGIDLVTALAERRGLLADFESKSR